ncbi:MAG TPA: glutathione S-transferase family protein [Burkholderiaceae bacterium]
MHHKLYSGTRNASSWTMRAWLALKEQGIAFEECEVDIRKPQRVANLAQIATFSAPGAVPVLVAGEAVIYDSLAIMEYANDAGDGTLLPADPVRRAQVRSMLSWQHSGLSQLCWRLSFESAFYPDKRAMLPDELEEAGRLFDVWEGALRDSGGPYLAGALSLADLAFVPTVLRILSHWRGAAPVHWPLSWAWSERLLARPAVEQWLGQARELPVVWLDNYLA